MKPLKINDLFANKPIVQGGMGIGISLSNLAGSVALEGGIGVISAAQPGYLNKYFEKNPLKTNLEALKLHISLAKKKSCQGIIGVNVMSAIKNYEEYVLCAIKNKADIIFSGAGMPLNLPKLVEGSKAKIAPIISSVKACSVLFKIWDKRYQRTADALVVEGPKAGGHLGFKEAELGNDFENELIRIIELIRTYEQKYKKDIPVIFGGGIFNNQDVKHYLSLGCSGIQVGTRFVATHECDAHINFKMAYVNAKKEDVIIVKSPVGLPGRALKNKFTQSISSKATIRKCYNCLIPCNPKNTIYCISQALIAAAKGDVDNGLVFCGENVHRIDKITSVKEVISEFLEE